MYTRGHSSGALVTSAREMTGRRTDAVMAGLCALAPACLAVARIGDVADAAHDLGVARALGLDAQPWRGLDVAVGALLAMLPIGTRASRAALGGALVTAAAGAALYFVVRRLLGACAETRRLGSFVAAIAATLPLVGAPWQIEASAVGGSVVGAYLVVLPLALLASASLGGADASGRRARTTAAAFALALAAGYEPLVGACAAAGVATFLVAGASPGTLRAVREQGGALGGAFVLGLAPVVLAVGRTRSAGVPVGAALAEAWFGERGASHGGSPGPFVREEIGAMVAVLAVGGAGLAMFVARARPIAAALVAVAVAGLASSWLGVPLGPTRYGGPVLAGLAATCALAGVALQAAVRVVAEARVPLARTSAAMIVVLELVMPVDRADEALARAPSRDSGASAIWNDAAWGALPPRSVVVVTEPLVYRQALAARALGALRGDLALVPAYSRNAPAWRALSGDASLVPLWRDLELAGMPGEAAMSSLAQVRPLVVTFDPRWGRALARHLVPLAFLDRFEPEPRGASDRRRALDLFAPERARVGPFVARDPELGAAAVSLLRARELGMELDGDRDLIARAQGDRQAFEPAARR